MAKGSDNPFPSLLVVEGTVPASPAAGDQRLYIDSATHHLKRVNSSGVIVDVEAGGGTPAALASASYLRSSADYTTTSATFVDIDGTNTNFTLTTGAHRVLVGATGIAGNSLDSGIVGFDVAIDGTRQGGAYGLFWLREQSAEIQQEPLNFSFLTDALTAASHTFHFQWRVSSGTGTLQASANTYAKFYVVELYA